MPVSINGDGIVSGVTTFTTPFTFVGVTTFGAIDASAINAGVVTSTSFVGNITGNATGLSGTPNLNVGVVTATSYYGSGANLTNLNIPAGFNELDAALFN